MTTPELICAPNPLLNQISQPVARVDDEVRALMQQMLKIMRNNNGIGLAAVQIGILKRIIVMDLSTVQLSKNEPRKKQLEQPIFMANAKIVGKSKKTQIIDEGCLSVQDTTGNVERPAVVRVQYLNYHNQIVEESFGPGLIASCVQHEIDHTNGILFTQRVMQDMQDLAQNSR